MTRFLLDADTSVFAIRRVSSVEASLVRVGPSAVTSTLVHSQLLQGIEGQPQPEIERALVAAFTRSIEVLPYDDAAVRAYGEIIDAIGYSRRDAVDRMIAAHAISIGATLVTNNTRDFHRIPNLALENWAEPS